MSTLEIIDLHVSIEDKQILKGVNLVMNTGEIHAIMGVNGSGKSTLMKAILGLKSPMAGTITTGDGLQPDEIGYLPQQTKAQKDFPATVTEVVRSGFLSSRSSSSNIRSCASNGDLCSGAGEVSDTSTQIECSGNPLGQMAMGGIEIAIDEKN